jgi:hypothetical protein
VRAGRVLYRCMLSAACRPSFALLSAQRQMGACRVELLTRPPGPGQLELVGYQHMYYGCTARGGYGTQVWALLDSTGAVPYGSLVLVARQRDDSQDGVSTPHHTRCG